MNRILETIARNMVKIGVLLVALMIVFPWVFRSAYVLRIMTVCMMYICVSSPTPPARKMQTPVLL